jgi:peptide deformylase
VKSNEGCLSFPDAYTDVVRYENIMVKAINENGKPFVMEVKGGNLLARAIQHENDHLDGILFIDHCLNRFETQEVLKKYNLPDLDPDMLIDEEEMKSQL